MKTNRIEERIRIRCSQQQAFQFTQDYNHRLKWDTFLRKADLLDGAVSAGKGVKAYCKAHNGMGMVTEYVSYNPPHTTAIKMTKGPMMFQSFAGTWQFSQIAELETEVVFIYAFKLRFPFNLGAFIIKRKLLADVRQRLMDLKRNLEVNDN